MGKKTVKWGKLKDRTPGVFTCHTCNNVGIVQEYDWICDITTYRYCDCYYGKQAEKKEDKNEK